MNSPQDFSIYTGRFALVRLNHLQPKSIGGPVQLLVVDIGHGFDLLADIDHECTSPIEVLPDQGCPRIIWVYPSSVNDDKGFALLIPLDLDAGTFGDWCFTAFKQLRFIFSLEVAWDSKLTARDLSELIAAKWFEIFLIHFVHDEGAPALKPDEVLVVE